MLALMLLFAAPTEDPATVIARSASLIAGDRCTADPDKTDITVCGRRRADRFRVPFVVHDAGDPKHEAVRVERDRLLNRTNLVQEHSPFLVGGGMSGVTVSSATGVSGVTNRPLAP